MSTRRKGTRTTPVKLNEEETREAAARMMDGAVAHQRASVWCMDKPDAKPPNIDWFYFTIVSLELILISLEQSLRLLLLLNYDNILGDTDHVPRVLYKAMLNKSGMKKDGVRECIVKHANTVGSRIGMTPELTEKKIVSCLDKHNASYTNFRHFQLNRQGRLNLNFGFTQSEVQILHVLALALMELNADKMKERGFGWHASMSPVPESEITDELSALMERLRS